MCQWQRVTVLMSTCPCVSDIYHGFKYPILTWAENAQPIYRAVERAGSKRTEAYGTHKQHNVILPGKTILQICDECIISLIK